MLATTAVLLLTKADGEAKATPTGYASAAEMAEPEVLGVLEDAPPPPHPARPSSKAAPREDKPTIDNGFIHLLLSRLIEFSNGS
jgi:hypothetical protein